RTFSSLDYYCFQVSMISRILLTKIASVSLPPSQIQVPQKEVIMNRLFMPASVTSEMQNILFKRAPGAKSFSSFYFLLLGAALEWKNLELITKRILTSSKTTNGPGRTFLQSS